MTGRRHRGQRRRAAGAAAIRRRAPDAFAPSLVSMLPATAGRAARIGRTDALAYADEAVRVARGLAGGRPAGHGEPDEAALARALRQRSVILATVGRYDEARRDLDEATAIFRRLADGNPGRSGAELAGAVAEARRLDTAAGERSDA